MRRTCLLPLIVLSLYALVPSPASAQGWQHCPAPKVIPLQPQEPEVLKRLAELQADLLAISTQLSAQTNSSNSAEFVQYLVNLNENQNANTNKPSSVLSPKAGAPESGGSADEPHQVRVVIPGLDTDVRQSAALTNALAELSCEHETLNRELIKLQQQLTQTQTEQASLIGLCEDLKGSVDGAVTQLQRLSSVETILTSVKSTTEISQSELSAYTQDQEGATELRREIAELRKQIAQLETEKIQMDVNLKHVGDEAGRIASDLHRYKVRGILMPETWWFSIPCLILAVACLYGLFHIARLAILHGVRMSYRRHTALR